MPARDPALAAPTTPAGSHADATIDALRRALLAEPGNLRVVEALAQALFEAGRVKESIARWRTLAAARPHDAELHAILGRVQWTSGATRDGIESFERAVALAPDSSSLSIELGDLLMDAGRPADAAARYRAAIAIDRRWVAPFVNLGAACLSCGDVDAAEAAYRDALAIDAGHADALNGVGAVRLARGDFAGAIVALTDALARDPLHRHARVNLGRASTLAGRTDDAIDVLQAAVADDPTADACEALAIALREADRLADATAWAREALRRDPRRPQVHVALGNLRSDANDLRGAIDAYRDALRLDPDHPLARWNLALAQLAAGDFVPGWKNYEARWRCVGFPSPRRDFAVPPLTRLADANGRTVLVHAEQGLGDTLQFVRFVPALAAAGARVIVEVQPPLVRLLERTPGADAVVARGDPLPPFDAHVPTMSLPRLLGRHAPDGRDVPYIEVPFVPLSPCPRRPDGRIRVGIAWAGGSAFAGDRRRSLPLAALAPLLQDDTVDWVGLQRDVPAADADDHAAWCARWPALADATTARDFADTAAAIADVDLVISVDTAVAHCAGAMGRPLWILLPHAPDFRWMLGRDDSPWYPTARLFRQPAPGAWPDVVAAVEVALTDHVSAGTR